ncbi:nuclear transport factor 2 family protein [Novosphingobium sp. JCM 18896]|uniref:nuclear transport factor 2 family protein n=1 Tax=Novosphingobium sp. JCM 18896 TaxID=2989731 RepID=UPI002222EA1F|nr:nuclear transport factor 2 family protein [Novosphingobium sp. JCM 18896]MCW1428579.1 nuclear transport factor 2 family protein [Novosphingobium sp. JCM 18896]
MTTPTSQILNELADREAIKECLYRYSRGVDRLDADMLRSAYWPDCVDEHMGFEGNAEEFIAWAFPVMGSMDQAQHFISNVLMAINGDKADVESYFYGFHRINTPDGQKNDVIGAGRYVDNFEKRGDEWRIMRRLVVTDWFRHYSDSADWSQGMLGIMIEPGGRYPNDESYKRLKLA